MVVVLKTTVGSAHRGFESLSLRQIKRRRCWACGVSDDGVLSPVAGEKGLLAFARLNKFALCLRQHLPIQVEFPP